ncbi:hypothetical protein [Candidatus Harpocratesius sp.]
MGEYLKPFHIHLNNLSRNGTFRIIFDNCKFFDFFCSHYWPDSKIFTKSEENPIKVNFTIDALPDELEEKYIIDIIKQKLENIGISIEMDLQTGIIMVIFPNSEFIFILLVAILQSLNSS